MAMSRGQRADLDSRIDFAKDLMAEFRQMNADAGINLLQSFQLKARFRSWTFTTPIQYGAVTFTISLFETIASGDFEGAYYALIWGSPDSMLLPYHWLNQERVDWLSNQLKDYLGIA